MADPVLQQLPDENAMVWILRREFDVSGVLRISLRAKVCTTDVDEGHLDPVRAGRITVLSGRAVEVSGGQREDRPKTREAESVRRSDPLGLS